MSRAKAKAAFRVGDVVRADGQRSEGKVRLFRLDRCADDAVRSVIERDHYLRRWPDPRSLPFAYRLTVEAFDCGDLRPHGILVFKKPQHHKQRGLFGYEGLPTSWQILDLARVWVHPELQAVRWQADDRRGRPRTMGLNVFSRMVGMGIRRVQEDWIDHHPPVYPDLPYHVEIVVSYCDRTHHQGIGYRASGFELLGSTNDGTKDLYVKRLKAPRWQYRPEQPSLLEAALA